MYVHRLLKPGGFIILDDLNWTFANSPSLKENEHVQKMPDDEKETPHIRKVYELLVKTHPDFYNFSVDGNWAIAQKRMDACSNLDQREVVMEKVIERQYYGLGSFLQKASRRLLNKLK